jgi:prepilin-type N-terminal cleavage/methylation domain-containing protein
MNRSLSQSGFTLIEMIVSLALFSVVVTISVGALLVLIASNQRFQNEQSVMTNLSFALDSMTREIRTGTNYYCASRPNFSTQPNFTPEGSQQIFRDWDTIDPSATRDCEDGNDYDVSGNDNSLQGVAFVEGGQSITGTANTKILYFYDSNEQNIFRRISRRAAQPLLSSDITVSYAEFYVSGAAKEIPDWTWPAPLSLCALWDSKPFTPYPGPPVCPPSMATANDEAPDTTQPTVTIYIEASGPTGEVYKLQTTVTQRALDL